MKAYVQSKSGNYNSNVDFPGVGTLEGILKAIRHGGGFYATNTYGEKIYVPFEEIEYVGKAQ